MAKVALGCIGKFIKGSGADHILTESLVFGVNVVESVLTGRNYARSLKGMQLLKEALVRLQLEAIKSEQNQASYRDLETVKALQGAVQSQDRAESHTQVAKFMASNTIIQDFHAFVSRNCQVLVRLH